MTDSIGPRPPLVCYRPSGRVSWRAPIRLALIAFPISLLFGWLYAVAVINSPLPLLTVVLCVAFIVCLSLLAGTVLDAGHSRSTAFNACAGAIVAFVALWVHWIVLLKHYGPGLQPAIEFATSGPFGWTRVLSELAGRLRETHSERDFSPFYWLLESVSVIGLTALISSSVWSNTPYSETLGAWSKQDFQGELWQPDASVDHLQAALGVQGAHSLLSMRQAALMLATPVASEWHTVSVTGRSVEADPLARWLTISSVDHTRQDDGRIKTRRQTVVDAWQVSDADYKAVMAHLRPEAPGELTTEVARGADVSPPLQSAVDALEAKRFDDVLATAMPYTVSTGAADDSTRTDANRLCALALSAQDRFAEALPYWKVVDDLEPSAHNLLQVASSSAVVGEVANAERWFDEAILRAAGEHREGERPVQPMMIANFVTALHRGGHSRAAYERLKVLGDWYAGLHITDSTFLYLRGMPFFETFVAQSAAVVRSVADEVDVEAWYGSLYTSVDEEGRTMLQAGRVSWGLDHGD